ncbi:MAG: class I SAM-dependent methyltransferase [Patescibacteria group bacterium]
MDARQKFDIGLQEIVPEYASKNPLVRWLFRKRLRVAREFLEQSGAEAVIDIGCGNGAFLREITASGKPYDELWGVDLNPAVVSLTAALPAVHFAVRDLLDTQFPSQKFDAIVSLDTLEHIENLAPALQEFRRIVKKGGSLIISEPVESWWYKTLRFVLKGTYSHEHGPGAGVHYHTARSVDRIVQTQGFSLVKRVKLPCGFPFDLFHVSWYRT